MARLCRVVDLRARNRLSHEAFTWGDPSRITYELPRLFVSDDRLPSFPFEIRRASFRAMSLEPQFVADCPYGPGGLLIDEILEIDRPQSRIRARMPTGPKLPLTREQRPHPERHPLHVSGGLMVHMTGMVGFIHAYYVLDMRHAEGWIGYGVRIHDARFCGLARPGPPLILEGWATRVRCIRKQTFVRYGFRFTQDESLIYEGDQTAVWEKIPPTP